MKNEYREDVDTLISQLRDRLDDVICSNKKYDNNFLLYRWLIHTNMKIDRAERAIRESLEWRAANNIDILAEQEWAFETPGMDKHISVGVCGTSKKGQPVVTINGEGVDFGALIKKYGKEGCRRYFIQWYAKLEKLMLEHGKETDILGNEIESDAEGKRSGKFNPNWHVIAPVQIVSYKNFSLWNATSVDALQVIAESFKIGMTYFPCCVSAVYAVNLNRFSNLVVKTMKPLLTSQSFIMEFFDTDKTKWSKVLLEHIDADQLPPYFGGSQSDSSNVKV